MWVDNLHNSPLVSVIMNAHNSEEFLAEAIKSVVEQTYQKWEIILWDNASKDESQSIAESFGDSRIHYHEIPGKVSLYTSRINAINHASGDLIAFLDCDDTWTPNKLTRQVPIFEDNSIVASCTDYYVHIEGDDLRAVEQDRVARTYRDKRVSLEQVVSEYRVGMLTLMVRRSSCLQFLPQQPPEFSIVGILTLSHAYCKAEILLLYLCHSPHIDFISKILVEILLYCSTSVHFGCKTFSHGVHPQLTQPKQRVHLNRKR